MQRRSELWHFVGAPRFVLEGDVDPSASGFLWFDLNDEFVAELGHVREFHVRVAKTVRREELGVASKQSPKRRRRTTKQILDAHRHLMDLSLKNSDVC